MEVYNLLVKDFNFHNQFLLTKTEMGGKKCYVEYWFRCPDAIEAPYTDKLLLRKLDSYKVIKRLLR